MPDLVYEKFDHYATFTMNRPERLNALGGTMQDDLSEALADFKDDVDMRVGIVTGNGRAFSAGADLKEMNERNQTGGRLRNNGVEGMMQFARHPKPFIAAINGLCLAGGMERAMDCDIRICSSEAYFGLFEVKRGILAGYAVHNMARLVNFNDTMYTLLTADRISPDDALRMGFVREVLAPDELMPRALEIAKMIGANAPLAVEGSKSIAQQWRQLQLDESLRFSQWVGRVVLTSEDSKEGPLAFVEKRPPVWKGR